MLFVVLCPGTPEGSTGSGSGFLKRLRKRENSLKSHPTDWEKPGIEPVNPFLLSVQIFCLELISKRSLALIFLETF